ncbi:MAG: PaaI family thioesterase [Parvibaculum sp.]|uniref:PaaI family thioesterase n=1 Tax=Parvibaculum sp. TaxID=2024848 RepID=UPI00284378D0|nr:PaaI family thioesterase [Parvibaculum sp.]MDR3498870.1 PaaI family thioesterase [Parvibaculum sp.]
MPSDNRLPPDIVETMKSVLIEHVPHARALGLSIVDAARGHSWVSVPYDEKLIGNVETGVIHGGVITTLLDNACGTAVQLALPERMSIATLDLRIDYMKPATPGLALMAHAHCYKVTRNIAFVRGTAYHTDEADPIATSVGTFMLAANRATPTDFPEATGFIAKLGDKA